MSEPSPRPRIPYTLRGLLSLWVTLPLLFQTGWIISEFSRSLFLNLNGLFYSIWGIISACFLLFCVGRGERYARQYREQLTNAGVMTRYRPVIIAFAYTLVIAAVVMLFPVPESGGVFSPLTFSAAFSHAPSLFLPMIAFSIMGRPGEMLLLVPLMIQTAFWLGMMLGYRPYPLAAPERRKGWWVVAGGIALLMIIGGRAAYYRSEVLGPIGGAVVFHGNRPEIENYRPLSVGNRLFSLRDPGLEIAADHPRLDGSTALFPVYAAAAQAIYTGLDEKNFRIFVDSQKTPMAYQRLLAGDADLIMVTPPSPAQLEEASEKGVKYHLTPVAREAFVFFVHKDNPMNGLTTEEIRAIYQKKIVNWKELGGPSEAIIPFQRPDGSGSQTAFLSKVMKETQPARPLEAERVTGMGGIIRETASYRNSAKAIGYSFRYYLSTMDGNPDIKMLAIDGVEPTRENIRNGTYPYITEIYLVTAGSENPHVQPLVDWFLSPKGQALIEAVGYVGVK